LPAQRPVHEWRRIIIRGTAPIRRRLKPTLVACNAIPTTSRSIERLGESAGFARKSALGAHVGASLGPRVLNRISLKDGPRRYLRKPVLAQFHLPIPDEQHQKNR
jgi:hypothetical protein